MLESDRRLPYYQPPFYTTEKKKEMNLENKNKGNFFEIFCGFSSSSSSRISMIKISLCTIML